MRFRYSPNGAYLHKRLISLLRHPDQHTTLIVNVIFNELVKETMLEKVQYESLSDKALLNTSLELVAQNLDADLKAMGVEVDFNSYKRNAEANLKFTSREMASLASAARSEEDHRQIAEPLVSIHGIRFQLSSLAMGSQFNGLFSFAVEAAVFDLEALQKEYTIEESWFPVTITKDNLLFIVEYSSILVNLIHLPSDNWPKAKNELTELMNYLIPI